jgi:P4 family phage/plasmid primase-like protien
MSDGRFLEQLFAGVIANPFDESWWSGLTINADTGDKPIPWAERPQDLEAQLLALGPRWHAYFGLATRTSRLPGGARGGAADCGAITAVALDIDVTYQDDGTPTWHKTPDLPPTRQHAHELLASHPQPPSLIVDTGGGLQAFWLLDEPLAAEQATKLLSEWNASWQERARLKGWRIDNTSDLARVYRLPGSWNPKADPPASVQLVGDQGGFDLRYTFDELREFLIVPAQPEPEPRQSALRIAGEELPGDWANRTQDSDELVQRAGFAFDHGRVDRHYRAPHRFDEKGMTGATVYADGHITIYSETWCAANPPFQVRTPYDYYGFYARLVHGGDFTAASRALAARRALAANPRPPQKRVTKAEADELQRSQQRHPAAVSSPADVPVNLEAVALAPEPEPEPESNVVEVEFDQAARFFTSKGKLLVLELAQAIRELTPIEVADGGQLYVYEDGVYSYDGQAAAIGRGVTELLGNSRRITQVREVEKAITAETPTIDPTEPLERIINCPNGLLDWRTGELSEHTPDVRSIVQIVTAWEPDAGCPRWEAWLDQALDAELHPLVYEMIGAAVYSGLPAHKWFLLFGGGRNGKSTLLQVIKGIVGSANCAAVPLQNLSESYMAAELFGKLVNLAGDLPSKAIADSSMLKGLIGDDVVTARRIYGTPFRFQSFAQLVFSANKLPSTLDTSRGFYSRMVIIPFDKMTLADDQIDHTVQVKLLAERPGILVKAIEGLRRATSSTGYTIPAKAAALMREYQVETNPVIEYSEERLIVNGDPTEIVSKRELLDDFAWWKNPRGGGELSNWEMQEFWSAMRAHHGSKLVIPDGPTSYKGGKHRVVKGVRFNR